MLMSSVSSCRIIVPITSQHVLDHGLSWAMGNLVLYLVGFRVACLYEVMHRCIYTFGTVPSGGMIHSFAVQDSQGMPLAQQEWAADPLFAPVSLVASKGLPGGASL